MFTRLLGRSGVEVTAMGLGCWAIGGPLWRGDQPVGWGQVDDDASRRAIRRALEMGVTFFDTADVYGAGHSEELLGEILPEYRDKVVIATKFGNVFDRDTRQITGADGSPAYIRRACEASLKRLNTDYIDLYQFHVGDFDITRALAVRDTLEELVATGKIRTYGWSTDDPERARLFAGGPHCTAIQQRLNILEGNVQVLRVCEEHNLASINRTPLAKGILTGKFSSESSLPADDVRYGWDFTQGTVAEQLAALQKLRDVLTADGRTLTQGALGWLWAKSDKTIPIPGFKTAAQVEENTRAMLYGPLSQEQMAEIDRLLGR